MLIQEKISAPDTLLKLYVAIDEDLKALRPQLQAQHLPRDPRGGLPSLSATEVLTILVWGAWRSLTDNAKVYFHIQTYHHQEFPTLGAYSKFIEATNRYSVEELFEILKGAFGAERTTHRATYALLIHLLCCLLAYSLYKSLIA